MYRSILLNIRTTVFVPATVLFLLASCAEMERTPLTQAMKINKNLENQTTTEDALGNASQRQEISSERGPAPPTGRSVANLVSSKEPPKLTGSDISVNFEGLRLPAFVNTVFGELLQVTFEISDSIMSREQLVTLRTAKPLPPDEFYKLATQVLGNYGVGVAYENNVYRIVENTQVQQELPRIVRTRAFSSIPGDMRPVFYYATIDNIRVKTMEVWLTLALSNRLQSMNVPYSNALLLLGSPDDVAAAIEVIEILDQPNLAGNQSLKITPVYWSVAKLAEQIMQVLRAEGYQVDLGPETDAPIKIIPVRALNTMIVFATSDSNLQHVLDWAAELDQPSQTIDTAGVYYHQVFNTNAASLVEIVSTLLGGGDQEDGGGATSESGLAGSKKIVVDESRNAIIFKGSAEEYAQFRALVDQMDRAPFEVLIEATVAEVTLDQGESLGVALRFDNQASASNRTVIESSGNLFVNVIEDTGRFTATLNAMADENRVFILSSPRLIASSGENATMQVGTQVPIITTQQTAADGSTGGSSNILQQVQYRNTGVVLDIQPIVNSSQRVELTITQEVSDAQSNDTSDIQSPIILTRSLTTTLSLDDGETVLLGGLISENYSTGNSGVPLLKDIPVLGNLFKSQSRSQNKTELIVLLTPYIIDGKDTARSVRDAFRNQLGTWAREVSLND